MKKSAWQKKWAEPENPYKKYPKQKRDVESPRKGLDTRYVR